MKKLGVFLALILMLLGVMVAKTLTFASRQQVIEPLEEVGLPAEMLAEGLSEAIRYETISSADGTKMALSQFEAFHGFLAQRFPLVHESLSLEMVGGHALLYVWKGRNEELEPILMLAHQDVVPVESGTEADWAHDAFSGEIDGGYIWGRGAIDDKASLMAMFEGAEALLKRGFVPSRSIYFAFGHDEEVGGVLGAKAMAQVLEKRGLHFLFTLDEGLPVLKGVVPGVEKPVGLIGVAEKGFISLELLARGEGGHSSMPPKETAVGILAQALVNVQGSPFPTSLEGGAGLMFDHIGPEMPFALRLVFANRWLLGPVISQILESKVTTNAVVRTTTAPTMLEGSPQDNVLPQQATAVINFRILPGNSIQGVMDHVQKAIDDERVAVKALDSFNSEPSKISSTDGPGFLLIERAIRQTYPEVLVTPGVAVGATDTRHYEHLADNSYRFFPVYFEEGDRKRIHGTNERISVESYQNTVSFYLRFFKGLESI